MCWPPRYKDFAPGDFDPQGDLLEQIEGLTLMALVGIMDPPRPEVKDAIATAHRAGIEVRMITGDHVVTAEAIGRELGIPGRAISGADFRAMSDEEALRELDDIGIIARVTPEDKVRLVQLLQREHRIVAMTGDGVNDAPALKQADIGVAMGITGTEVSKEAAVMILTDDDFTTIVRAVSLGRNLYDNLKKYIRFQMAGLFGFIATFLGSSIFWIADGVPFLPTQTIWVNFSVQVAAAFGLGFGAATKGLMDRKPRPVRCAHPVADGADLPRGRGPDHGHRHAAGHPAGLGRIRGGRRSVDGPGHVLVHERRLRAGRPRIRSDGVQRRDAG